MGSKQWSGMAGISLALIRCQAAPCPESPFARLPPAPWGGVGPHEEGERKWADGEVSETSRKVGEFNVRTQKSARWWEWGPR
jgi:hypothetical protein